jgi:hypothetical protein
MQTRASAYWRQIGCGYCIPKITVIPEIMGSEPALSKLFPGLQRNLLFTGFNVWRMAPQ